MDIALPNIEATASTSQVKKYLMYFGSGKLSEDVITSALEKAAHTNSKENDLIHLQIFLFLNDSSVRNLLDKFRKQLLPLIPLNTTNGGITMEYYFHLIFQLNLHDNFIEMVSGSSNNELTIKLISSSIPRVIQAFKENFVSLDTLHMYLNTLAQICNDGKENKYQEMFTNLIHFYIDQYDAQLVPKYETLVTLLRIIGLICLEKEEITENTEISDLIRQTAFDPAITIRHSRTHILFKAFHENGGSFQDNDQDRFQILQVLEEICRLENFRLTETEKANWLEINTNHSGLSRLKFIGACGQITQLILRKVIPKVGFQLQNLESFVGFWSQFKPKVSFEDFEENIKCFDDICNLIIVHGNHPRYRNKWFEEFLKYPGSCTSSVGLTILENILSTNSDNGIGTSLALVEKLQDSMIKHQELSEKIKDVILMIATNELVSNCADEFVNEVYKDGVHCDFMKFNFGRELHCVLAQTGALEEDPKAKYLGGAQVSCLAKERDEYRKMVFQLYFENPIECTMKMLPLALRTQKFQTLHFVKVFLELKMKETDQPKVYSFSSSPNLLQSSLFKLLISTHEKDSLFEVFENNLCMMVKEKFLSFIDLYQIVECALDNLFVFYAYGKWLKVLRVYTSLFHFAVESKNTLLNGIVERFLDYAERLVLCTAVSLISKIHQPLMEAREKGLEILDFATKSGFRKENEVEFTTEELEEIDLQDIGLFYMRCPGATKSLLKYTETTPLFLSTLNGNTIVGNILNWVTNSCRLEWDGLLDFTEHLLKFKPEINETVHSVVNDTILLSTEQSNIRITHYLAFYSHFLHYQQSSNYVAYKEMFQEHKNVVKTFVSLLRRLNSPSRVVPKRDRSSGDDYRSALVQQCLLLLLEFVEWIILKSSQFEKIQHLCLKLVTNETVAGTVKTVGCNSSLPIYQTIITKITNGKDDTSTFERNMSTLVISNNDESGVQVKISKNSKAEILENYTSFYQRNEMEQEEQTKIDLIESRDLYPFQQSTKEASVIHNVELKFD